MMGKMEIRSPPGSRPRDGRHCDLCGCSQPAVRCDKCGCQIFCLSCDDMYHRHPKRRFHLRKAVDPMQTVQQARPVLPMKAAQLNTTNPGDPSKMPLPPPRKKKSLFGSFRKPSPSSDNSPPLPKKEYSWTDRLGSIKKFMSNRPLPPLPPTDDTDGEQQPTTNGQSNRGDLSFIHKRNEERPPQLPQRSPRSPDAPVINQEKENRIPSHMSGQIRNGSQEPNTNHVNQNLEFPSNEGNHWNHQMNKQNGSQAFGTLNRHSHQRNFIPPGAPGYPGGMHQSSSATDLHSMNNAEGVPGVGPIPPHYYPMNPHMPPHYPYPMYPHPQFHNYPQYFGNSFANLTNPPTSEGDFSDSESASKHSSKKHQFRKRAKRSQSVMMDRMAFPGQYFPFGPYPGYGPWGAQMPVDAPPSPSSSVRSLTRSGRSRRRRKMTSEDDDDDEFSVSSSPMSRPKSSSSDPKEQPRAPLATQTTSSEEESDGDIAKRRNKIATITRQSEPVSVPSPVKETHNNIAKAKQISSRQSDSDARGTPEIRNEVKSEMECTANDSPQPVQHKPSTQTLPANAWECNHCTFINPIANRICQVCCKTTMPTTESPVTGHSRPSSAVAVRKENLVPEKESPSTTKVPEVDENVEKKDKQDMASLNSALDEAEKQISKGLEELMRLKDDIDSNNSKEKPKPPEKELQPETQETSKPVYKSSGKMRTSILDKLNLNKPQTSNVSVSTSTETQTGQNNWIPDKIIKARTYSNSSSTSDAYNSPLAQSPDLERNSFASTQKRDSSCQTQQDTIAEYLEKRKAADEAFLGRPLNNFGFGYGDRMDMVTSPVPSMYDRFYGGGYGGGMMQRSHSRASLFAGRMNDFGPMDYGGPGLGYGPAPMFRSVSRGSLTGDYPDGRMSDFHNLRKPDYYLSMEELVERRRQDNIRAQGLELVRMIREAEQQGFNADDIQVALTHCGKQNPMEWLQENWRNMVDSVLTLSTNYGNDKKENDIGLLSENEARDALRLHKGNIWAAVTECVEGRQRKYLELSARGNFSRQDVVDALTSSDGDVEMAYAKLTKSTGKPFLMRIWGAGEGVQNQDGARPIPEDFHGDPRMYRKEDNVNSDEMSEELWSEDGEWDDEDVYDEEREFEDLQTCHEDLQTCHEDLQTSHEDLQTSPQEMLTPESDRSDYCDAFPTDDRNASSPSDDIFFVVPEAKVEKKKGFLSKLAALRKDSREQVVAIANISKDDIAPEPRVLPKEDTISQKSNSSSEQQKGSGALSTLKNTLSAIKDTVTGGSKSDKKIPCSQPEKRTIIVKGQIDHTSLINDSNENVKLTSIKPIGEGTVSSPKSEREHSEPSKPVDGLFNKESNKNDKNIVSLTENLTGNDQSQRHKINANTSFDQVEPKSKQEKIKPQSLAERLKFAKQNRSSVNLSSTSGIQKEAPIPDTKIKDNANAEIDGEKLSSNQVKRNTSDDQRIGEIKSETDALNQGSNNMHIIAEPHKKEDIIPNANNNMQPSSENDAIESQNNILSSVTQSSPTDPQGSTKEINMMKTITTPEPEILSAKELDSRPAKIMIQTEQTNSSKPKAEEISTNKIVTDTRSQSVSPVVESPNKDKFVENKSQIVTNENKTTQSVEKSKSDAVKGTSSSADNKITSAETKTDRKVKEKPNTAGKKEQVPVTSFSVDDNSVIPEKKDLKQIELKESTPQDANATDETTPQTGSINLEKANIEIDAPQILNEPLEMAKALENQTSPQKETSTNQNYVLEKSVTKLNEVEDAKTAMVEGQAIERCQDTLENIVTVHNIPTKEIVSTNSSEVISKSQSETTSVLMQTENKTNELEVTKILPEINNSIVSDDALNSAQKTEVLSENNSTIESIDQVKNLPTTSSNQDSSENVLEQPAVDNSKAHIDFNNCASEEKPHTPQETSEHHKSEQINADKKSSVEIIEKDNVIEKILEPPSTSAQNNESVEVKDADSKPIQNLETSHVPTEANRSNDAVSLLSEKQNDSPSSSANETATNGKIKSAKESKLKKTGKGKNESTDKGENSEVLKSSLSSEFKSSNTSSEGDNKTADNNSKKDVPLSGEMQNELIEKPSNEKETLINKKLEGDVSGSESKKDTSEVNIQATEGTKVLNEVNKPPPLENVPEGSSELTQNAASSKELQSKLPAKDVTIPSISKVDNTTTENIPAGSETEKALASSKEIAPISSEVDTKAVSVKTALPKSDISNEVQDSKYDVITDGATSSNDGISKNSKTISTSNESSQDNFKKMPPVSSTTFPNKPKTFATSSSASVPGNSNAIVPTSSTTVADKSKEITDSSNVNAPVASKTIADSKSSTISNSSKSMTASTNTPNSDTSGKIDPPSSGISKPVPDVKRTPDASKTITDSKLSSVSNSSKSVADSSSASNSDKTFPSSVPGISKPAPDVKTLIKVNKEADMDTKITAIQEQSEQHSKVPDAATTNTPLTSKPPSSASTISQPGSTSLKQSANEDLNSSQAGDSGDDDIEDSDDSRPSSVTPPSPVDALRNRFEGLAGGPIRGGPIRPASPFRRMSFNSRKQVIALEKKRDPLADKPWFRQKIVNEPAKLPQPKRTIKQQLEMERKVRKMVADRKCRTYRKAEIVVQLMDMNFEEEESIQAANECSTLELAISYLQQECLLCTGNFPVSQIVSMTHCEHRACLECIRAYFTVQIRDRTILDLLCPFCNEPDIGDEDVAQDYFNHLDIMLKKLVDIEIHELFQRKLRDRVLMKDPNFIWCSQCSSGFISMPNLKRLTCPDCNAVTCASCRRLWERDHQGISCEAFAALKDASDSDTQAAGLAKLLTEDGIDCPRCHFRYALAKGGCMHFRCIQCQHDFCSGCSRPFKMGQKCGVSEFCAKLGLHAHHPRNCLFYLRDKEPEDLQKLLDMSDVKYNREIPDDEEINGICQVMEQKETADGMLDDHCGKEVQDGFAGLCRVHYVEYLGQLVNKHKVDPIQIFDNDDLELVLRRANIRLPPKRYRESEAEYREKLVDLIQEELPLDKMDGS